MSQPERSKNKSTITRRKRAIGSKNEERDEIKIIAKAILKEAKKRARYEMECLTDMVLQEARVAARYAHVRPFYIA